MRNIPTLASLGALALRTALLARVGADPSPTATSAEAPTEPPGSSGATSSGATSSSSSGATPSSSSSSGDPSTPVTCYPDNDGDGYAGPGAATTAPGSCPPRTTNRAQPTDCDDQNADRHPGQERFFSAASGSYDYDCNGAEEKRFFDSQGRARPTFTDCNATTESDCHTRYVERTNGTMPAVCGQPTDAALACMWRGGACEPSAFEAMSVRCR